MSKIKPDLDLKKRIVEEATNAANAYKSGKYKNTDEKLIDVIEGAIEILYREFSDVYSRSVIQNTMAVIVLNKI